ncbi:MAG: response regulator [Aggregatilineales bacterium]
MSETIDEQFLDQVKQALENLYDLPYLQRHPLAESLPAIAGELPGQRLRSELKAAIETLNPGKNVAVRSGAARLYHLMHLHYIGGMTLQETAYELGISLRQAYRDLRRGHEGVSEILRYKYPPTPNAPQDKPVVQGDVVNASSLATEVERLEGTMTTVALNDLLAVALRAVGKLAEGNNVHIRFVAPDDAVKVLTNAMVAQQVFVNLISRTVQQVRASEVVVELRDADDIAELQLQFHHSSAEPPKIINPVITQFLQGLGWRYSLTRTTSSSYQLTLRMSDSRVVLIIDDNEGLVELLERYFSGQMYQVISAQSGTDGLALAVSHLPDIIIMDLMMPGMDGWELLQHLRTRPETRDTPVIICSVINDPELAYSLGASEFISKPVSKDRILESLKKVGV